MAREGLTNFNDIKNRILTLEDKLVSMTAANNTSQQKENQTAKTTKWCKYHKTSTHDTTECIKLKSMNTKFSERNQNTKLQSVITIPGNPIDLIKIPVKICDRQVEAIVDTGSQLSYISNKLATTLGLLENATHVKQQAEAADQNKHDIRLKIQTKIMLPNQELDPIPVELYVFPNLSTEILICNDFLNKNDTVINFN